MQGDGQSAVINPGAFLRAISTVITLTGGTIFLMWLGEQMTQRGVGNGISLIIFSGIVANLPIALAQAFSNWARPICWRFWCRSWRLP